MYVRWKQYMTDQQWSNPVLLIRREHVQEIGAIRPAVVLKSFGDDARDINNWLDKLLVALPHPAQHAEDVKWLRSVVDHTLVSHNTGPSLDEIVDDLRRLGRRGLG